MDAIVFSGSSLEGESQAINEILSTIQELHNNPTPCKLPNTEFHKLNNNSTSKNKNCMEKGGTLVESNNSRLSGALCAKLDGKSVLVSRQTSTVRLPKNSRLQDQEEQAPVKEEFFIETPARQYVDITAEQYSDKRRRSNADESVKTYIQCSGNKVRIENRHFMYVVEG